LLLGIYNVVPAMAMGSAITPNQSQISNQKPIHHRSRED
jgi:hypothetical protein